MLTDPRIGFSISLIFAAGGLLWLFGQWFAADAVWQILWPHLGYGTHALTLLSIVLVVAAPLVALLFWRYAKVRSDLLAGRNVIARWKADPTLFRSFGALAEKRDLAAKRGALVVILILLAVTFGMFALVDPDVARPMLITGAAVALVVIVAFWWSNRTRRKQLEFRSGEIIVGNQGLLVNDMLHVWSVPMSWLCGVEFERGRVPMLTITYATAGRNGAQYIGVMLPVPPEAMPLAREVKRRLELMLRVTSRRSARTLPGKAPKP